MSTGDDNRALQRLEERGDRALDMLREIHGRLVDLSVPPMEIVTVGEVSRTMPVIRSLDELMDAVGEEIGRRLGEATARGEEGARDAWQIALAALAHLRVCLGTALQATPGVQP